MKWMNPKNLEKHFWPKIYLDVWHDKGEQWRFLRFWWTEMSKGHEEVGGTQWTRFSVGDSSNPGISAHCLGCWVNSGTIWEAEFQADTFDFLYAFQNCFIPTTSHNLCNCLEWQRGQAFCLLGVFGKLRLWDVMALSKGSVVEAGTDPRFSDY